MEKKTIKLNVIFMGTSSFAATVLESLIQEKYNLVAVYTQPGKKSGRSQETFPSRVKIMAEKHNIPVFEPEHLTSKVSQEISQQKPDLIIVVAYGKIIPRSILDIPGFGIINIHASLLPKFRGPSPIQNAILRGEKETGTTLMLMDAGVDTGDILAQKKIPIGEKDTQEELSQKIAKESSALLLKTLPDWVKRRITPQRQKSDQANYCQLIERSDGKILWSDTAREIYNKFRAFQPWPGIFSYLEINGILKRIKFTRIDFQEENPQKTRHLGEVFENNKKIAIQTAQGLIFPLEVQIEGKNKMKIDAFLNGTRNFTGSLLK